VLFCYRVYVLSTLTDFRFSTTSPLDLSSDLNAHLKHEVIAEIAIEFMSILKPTRSMISVVLCGALLTWSFIAYRRGKFKYKPIHIVRDMGKHQAECVVRILLILGILVCAVVNLILSFL
jgi:hypothetical protein